MTASPNRSFARFLQAHLFYTVVLFPMACCGGLLGPGRSRDWLTLAIAGGQLLVFLAGTAWFRRGRVLIPTAILGAPALLWAGAGGHYSHPLAPFARPNTAPVDRYYGLWGHYWTFSEPHPDPTIPATIFSPAALALELEWVVLVGFACGVTAVAWRAARSSPEPDA